MARHVKKGDTVIVISGKHKGEQGQILEVLVEKDRVRIEGVNTIKRHLKPGRDPKVPQGGIIEKFGTRKKTIRRERCTLASILELFPEGGTFRPTAETPHVAIRPIIAPR